MHFKQPRYASQSRGFHHRAGMSGERGYLPSRGYTPLCPSNQFKPRHGSFHPEPERFNPNYAALRALFMLPLARPVLIAERTASCGNVAMPRVT